MASKSRTSKVQDAAYLAATHERNLVLNPSYQRNAVWSKGQKQFLIDSMLRNYDIPKLYLRDTGDKYEVVDGQQRLRTVFEFWKDEISVAKDAEEVAGVNVAGLKFSELSRDLRRKIEGYLFDIVFLGEDWTDEDVKELFLRLQNGASLNAAEKRRALPSNMCKVVEHLASHPVFENRCLFNNKRFHWEDASAKCLQLAINERIVNIRAADLHKLFLSDVGVKLTLETPVVKSIWSVFDFMNSAFAGVKGELKIGVFLSIFWLVYNSLKEYNLRFYSKEFGEFFRQFERLRADNKQRDEDEPQDPEMIEYSGCLRDDSMSAQKYRYDYLKKYMLLFIPQLVSKDPRRDFNEEQREAAYWKANGICQGCRTSCDRSNFHTDHIIPHSKGGTTSIDNAQLLCPACNLKKSNE